MRFLISLALTLIVTLNAAPVHAGDVKWLTFDEGLKKASEAKKPLFMDVYTKWCGWCKRMDATTFADPAVAAIMGHDFVTVKLDAESPREFDVNGQKWTDARLAHAKPFEVSGYPCFFFMSPDGQVITKVPGYVPTAEFKTMLTFVRDEKYKTMEYEAYAKEQQALAPHTDSNAPPVAKQ